MRFIDRAVSWYFSRQALPYWSILAMDCLLMYLSGVFVFVLTNGALATASELLPLAGTLAAYLVCYVISFRVFHTYSGVMRFSSIVDLRRLGIAVLVGLVLALFCQYVFGLNEYLVPLSVPDMLLSALLGLVLMWTMRICVKSIYDTIMRSSRHVRVFIYGVREGGIAIAKSINAQSDSPYVVSGFASDQSDMSGKSLMGIKVYDVHNNLIESMRGKHASVLLVSPLRREALRQDNDLVNDLISNGIKIMMIPAAREWDGKSELSYTQLREVNAEDLLPRDKIEIDMDAVGKLLHGKRILITGAAGSIGSEMVRQIAPFNPSELILIDQAETPLHDIRLMMAREWPSICAHTIVADIANERRMEEIFSLYRPEYVFHAAAYKHVPMMEDNPSESIENNVNGTRIVADLAVKYGTKKFVMVSTDKAVNPTNVMGCSKRICEIYVQSLDKAIKDGR